ncbi:MAG: cell division protein ZapD, partial [Nitrosospira sp.]|nr:cell division protein ZapD [Nitrosospira sp.]
MICYEHPLNERIRTLLRLEDLFEKVAFFSARDEAVEHHSALVTLFEILDVLSRGDMKSDLLQELERQKQALETMRQSPAISEDALDEVLGNIQAASYNMLNMSGKIGEHMREDEWLMSVKQRAGIPGGACEFDLPSYHYWLHLDSAVRRNDLDEWLAPLLPLAEGFSIVLHLLRNSGKSFRHTARRGVFQQMGPGRGAHMLCLKLNESLPCVPEISANKYALNIRFVISGSRQKTKVYEDDVAFEL